MLTAWPTPSGLVPTLQKAIIGIDILPFARDGVALVSIIEADIESIKNIAIVIAAILFLANFMYFSSPIFMKPLFVGILYIKLF
jgi:hypothetical protein